MSTKVMEKKTTEKKEMAAKTPVKAATKTAAKTEAKTAAKTAAKTTTKTAAKTTAKTAAKKDIKVQTFIQYYGNQLDEKEIISDIKKVWRKSGKKVGDIKAIDLYIKPEDFSVYYVINGKDTGSISF